MILFITGRKPGSFFFEYKGKIIYAFPYVQNPASGKWVIMMRMEKR
jgi:hypothetical protein